MLIVGRISERRHAISVSKPHSGTATFSLNNVNRSLRLDHFSHHSKVIFEMAKTRLFAEFVCICDRMYQATV